MVNVARFSFSRPGTNEFTGKTAPQGLVNGTDPLQYFAASAGRQDGIVNVGGLAGIGAALQLPFNTTQNRYTEGDDLTWTHGAHTTRMGASVSRLQSNTYMPFFDGAMWQFTGLANGPFPLLGGIPAVLLYVPLGIVPQPRLQEHRSHSLCAGRLEAVFKAHIEFGIALGIRYYSHRSA